MKMHWEDPTKKPASSDTMNTKGDFGQFTDFMRRIVAVKPNEEKKPTPSSPAPGAY